MLTVKISQIVIPENRERKEFTDKAMAELRDSIVRNGLFHPITVEANHAEGSDFILRAGERRFRVCSQLASENIPIRCGSQQYEVGELPVVLFDELSDLQRLEVEIEENLRRTDFTWQERTQALARLHTLRAKQNPGQTIKDTASEVVGKSAEGSQISAVSEALVLAKHLSNPDVAKAATPKEALKVIKKAEEAKHRAKLALTFDSSKTRHTLTKGDSLELLLALPDAAFDVLLTDPPYGIDAGKFGSMAGVGHEYNDSKEYFDSFANLLAEQSYRVCKERAHAYVFCDPRRFDRLATLFELSGWTVFPTPLIWDKGNGMLPLPEHGPKRTYETILYAFKGDRPVLAVKNDVIRISSLKRLNHGAQKPVALYCELLSRSANAGDSILDPFAGSGTIFVAANRTRTVATGMEISEDFFNLALTRINTKEIDDGEDGSGIELDI